MYSLRRDMSCVRVSPDELETCMRIGPKAGNKCQDANPVIIVPDEEFPRGLVSEYGWVSFAYRLTLRRRGTTLTSTQQRDLRSLLRRNTSANAGRFDCTVCRLSFPDDKQLQGHLMGRYHRTVLTAGGIRFQRERCAPAPSPQAAPAPITNPYSDPVQWPRLSARRGDSGDLGNEVDAWLDGWYGRRD